MQSLDRILATHGPIRPAPLHVARGHWHGVRSAYGLADHDRVLSDAEYNAKLRHTAEDTGTWCANLALAPAESSGLHNACQYATPACRAACVGAYGRGAFPHVRAVRAARTALLALYPDSFGAILAADIERAAAKYGDALRVRLNAFSDLRFEVHYPALFERFPAVRFYDYTKYPARRRPAESLPPNYSLTYSASERTTTDTVRRVVESGRNVAVILRVSKGSPLPATWQGLPVIDGDASDDRTADPAGVIVGLRAKGPLRTADPRGFSREAGQ